MKRCVAAVAMLCVWATPASATEIKRQVLGQPVVVSVQHCEYPEYGTGECRDGVTTPVASSTQTCRYSPYFEYPMRETCADRVTLAGYTVTSSDCTTRTYEDYTETRECSTYEGAGVGSVRVMCEGELEQENSYTPTHEQTDTCIAKAAGAEITLVTCETPRENSLHYGLPPAPECEPAP